MSFHPDNGNGSCNYDFVHELNSPWMSRLLLSLTSACELSPQQHGRDQLVAEKSKVVTQGLAADGQVINPYGV